MAAAAGWVPPGPGGTQSDAAAASRPGDEIRVDPNAIPQTAKAASPSVARKLLPEMPTVQPVGEAARIRVDPRAYNYSTDLPAEFDGRPTLNTDQAKTTGFAPDKAYSHPMTQDARYAKTSMPQPHPQHNGPMRPP